MLLLRGKVNKPMYRIVQDQIRLREDLKKLNHNYCTYQNYILLVNFDASWQWFAQKQQN
jgi:hypothetical protein